MVSGMSFIALFIALFLLAVPVAALVMLITGIVMLARQRGVSSASAEGRCGKCGYLAAGLTTFVCPECGSDLRVVGIHAPLKSRGLAVGLTISGAVVLVLMCAGFFGLLFFRVPSGSARTVQIARPSPPRVAPPTAPPAPTPPVPSNEE